MSEATATQAVPRRSWTQAFQALSNRNFRLYWVAMLVSSLGSRLQMVALTWLVLKQTNSGFALGTVAMAASAPILLFSLFGGALADRLPKRPTLLITQAAMLIQALLLAILVATGAINLWLIYALSAVAGLIEALDTPTEQAFVKDLVGPNKEELANATELWATLFNGTKVAGPALGGVLVAAFGEAACFYLNAVSFLAVIVALLLVDKRRLYPTAPPPRASLITEVKAGVSYALRIADIATIVLLLAALGLFGYNLGVLLPLIARYLLTSGPVGLGLISAALGAGSLLGSLFVDFEGMNTRLHVLVGALVFTVMLLALSLFHGWLLILTVTVLLGFGSVLFLATANARLQVLAPDDFRGRIMGIYTLLLYGTTPFGSLFAGALADRIGIRETLAVLAVLCGLGVVATFVYLHRHRAQLQPDPTYDPAFHAEERLTHHVEERLMQRLALYRHLFQRQ